MNTKNEKITVTFSMSGAAYCRLAAKMAGVKLTDRTEEVGHYDRESYATNQDGWDKIDVIMRAARSVATGTEKGSLSRAIRRIRTSEQIAKEQAEFAACQAKFAGRKA